MIRQPVIRFAGLVAALGLATSPASAQAPADRRPAPFPGDEMYQAFHGQAGVDRIVDDLVTRSAADPRMAGVLKGVDLSALRRALKAELCYVLGGGCAFAGEDVEVAGKGRGATYADFAALVENLQVAMTREGVPPRVQNRVLARLAPMNAR